MDFCTHASLPGSVHLCCIPMVASVLRVVTLWFFINFTFISVCFSIQFSYFWREFYFDKGETDLSPLLMRSWLGESSLSMDMFQYFSRSLGDFLYIL